MDISIKIKATEKDVAAKSAEVYNKALEKAKKSLGFDFKIEVNPNAPAWARLADEQLYLREVAGTLCITLKSVGAIYSEIKKSGLEGENSHRFRMAVVAETASHRLKNLGSDDWAEGIVMYIALLQETDPEIREILSGFGVAYDNEYVINAIKAFI
jgi:hypothetical protein